MGRRDTRPEPETRANVVEVGRLVQPPFKIGRGCGYIYTRSNLVGAAPVDCGFGLVIVREFADYILDMVPVDYWAHQVRVWPNDREFRRCGEDADCQGPTEFVSPFGRADNLMMSEQPFIIWSLGGYYHDPTGVTRSGYTRVFLTTSGAYRPAPGRHRYHVDEYPAWRTFRDRLADHPWLFADKYGRKCVPHEHVLLGFSAWYQKRYQRFGGGGFPPDG